MPPPTTPICSSFSSHWLMNNKGSISLDLGTDLLYLVQTNERSWNTQHLPLENSLLHPRTIPSRNEKSAWLLLPSMSVFYRENRSGPGLSRFHRSRPSYDRWLDNTIDQMDASVSPQHRPREFHFSRGPSSHKRLFRAFRLSPGETPSYIWNFGLRSKAGVLKLSYKVIRQPRRTFEAVSLCYVYIHKSSIDRQKEKLFTNHTFHALLQRQKKEKRRRARKKKPWVQWHKIRLRDRTCVSPSDQKEKKAPFLGYFSSHGFKRQITHRLISSVSCISSTNSILDHSPDCSRPISSNHDGQTRSTPARSSPIPPHPSRLAILESLVVRFCKAHFPPVQSFRVERGEFILHCKRQECLRDLTASFVLGLSAKFPMGSLEAA